MTQRVVFLGGGTGGVMAANRLARIMSEDVQKGDLELMVLTDSDEHFYQPGLLYIALDQAFPEGFARPEKRVLLPGVQMVLDPAVRVLPGERAVVCQSGKKIEYDYLVVATGSVPDLDAIPGFREGAHSFYTLPEAMALRGAVQRFAGGKVLLIIGVPHKCPVAPLEFMFMFDEALQRSGMRSKVELTYTYPIGRLHSLEPVADWAEQEFARRDIRSETFFNVETVDPERRVVSTLEGEERGYDLLIGIPPHTGARVVKESGLGDRDGWIPTDRGTLRMKGQERIYVLGDATDLPISKAGSTAHYQSEIVARNVAHELRGEPATSLYDGKVFCFIEAGLDEATHITFDYKTPPHPSEPGAMVHWFKLAFNEMYWLSLRGLI